jgi:ABC-type nitrate/sulfonate/bicarbonate transport system substrate-binding protein
MRWTWGIALGVVGLILMGCGGGAEAPTRAPAGGGAASAAPSSSSGAPPSGQPLDPVTYALPSASGLFVPPVLAEEMGFFREEGLAVTLPVMRPNMLVPALVASEADYIAASTTAVRSALAGMPVRVVATMVDKSSRRLMAMPGIQSLDQLRGQAIAVSTIGDGPYNHATIALEYLGIDPGEMTWFALGHSAERLTALQQGQVPASVFSAAEIPRAEAMGLVTLLRLESVAPLPQAGVATSVKKLETDRPQIKRMLRATVRALQYLRSDRAGSVRVFEQFLGLSPEDAEQAYDASVDGYSSDGTLTERAMRMTIAGEQRQLGRTGDVSISEVADFGPLHEMLTEWGWSIPPDAVR